MRTIFCLSYSKRDEEHPDWLRHEEYSIRGTVDSKPDEPITLSGELLRGESDLRVYQVDGLKKINIGQFRLTLIGPAPYRVDEFLYSLDTEPVGNSELTNKLRDTLYVTFIDHDARRERDLEIVAYLRTIAKEDASIRALDRIEANLRGTNAATNQPPQID